MHHTIPVLLQLSVILSLCPAIIADPLPDTLRKGETLLICNGKGTRSRYMIKAYTAALYLEKRMSDAPGIIHASSPMAIRMHIISGLITADRLEESTREGFRNSLEGKTEQLRNEIETFMTMIRTDLAKGDMYEFHYRPGPGTEVRKNDILLGVIPGFEFKKALFGIWLCEKPAQEDLKRALVGKH
jgi:hypothetical protein